MAKFSVAVTEIIEYLVPVEAETQEEAEHLAREEMIETSTPNDYFVACRCREVEGVNVLSESEAAQFAPHAFIAMA